MSAALLEVRELARHYRVGAGWWRRAAVVRALDGLSFTLQAGRTLAVVGESGCGKSTLARQLSLIEAPTAGALRLDGVDMAGADRATLARMRQRVQMVFQNPFASLNPRKTIAATLEEPLRINTGLKRAERLERVAAMVDRVGLRREHLQRYPHMFSGGQRQRVAIARAMMLKPSLVVADEPVSALDVSIQAQILNLFMDLQETDGSAYVFISHNLAVVEHMAQDLMVMYLGRAVEYGEKARIFAQPLHPYTQALMSATPALHAEQRRPRMLLRGEPPSPLRPPPGCAFHQRCPLAKPRCSEQAPALRPLEGRMVACHEAG